MGLKPRSNPTRAVWLSRESEDDGCVPYEVYWWIEKPALDEYGAWGVPSESREMFCMSDHLDIDVPTDRPIRVRLHVEVLSEGEG